MTNSTNLAQAPGFSLSLRCDRYQCPAVVSDQGSFGATIRAAVRSRQWWTPDDGATRLCAEETSPPWWPQWDGTEREAVWMDDFSAPEAAERARATAEIPAGTGWPGLCPEEEAPAETAPPGDPDERAGQALAGAEPAGDDGETGFLTRILPATEGGE